MAARTPSLATLAIPFWALLLPIVFAAPAGAQNLEAGKSPAQIFAGTCTACHKGSRGLLKTVSPGSLPGFLREHYTTSSNMADALSAYLIAGGDGRPAGTARQTSAAADGNAPPEVVPAGRKPRETAAEGQSPPDQLPKGPKARAKAAALAKAEAAKAAEAAKREAAAKADAKTEVAALPVNSPPLPKPPLADIGAKPAEDPADRVPSEKPKEAALPAANEPRPQVARTDPVEQPKSDATKVKSASPKVMEEAKPMATAPASEQVNREPSKPVSPAPNVPSRQADATDVAAAKVSVSSSAKAPEGAARPQPAANAIAPPPSPPISY